MLQICRNIKQARVLKGLSQEDMAQRVNVTRSTYKNWEEKTEPELAILKTIAGALDIPAYSLLKGVIEFDEKNKSDSAGEPDLLTLMEEHANAILLSLQEIRKAPQDVFQRGLNVVPGSVQKGSDADKKKTDRKQAGK